MNNNGNHGQGTHCNKMGADSFAENTPNAWEFICPICLPKPKCSGFQWKKASLGVRSPCPIPSVFVLVVVVLLFSSQYVQTQSINFKSLHFNISSFKPECGCSLKCSSQCLLFSSITYLKFDSKVKNISISRSSHQSSFW